MAEVTCDQRRVVQRLLLDPGYPALTRTGTTQIGNPIYEVTVFGQRLVSKIRPTEAEVRQHFRWQLAAIFDCNKCSST